MISQTWQSRKAIRSLLAGQITKLHSHFNDKAVISRVWSIKNPDKWDWIAEVQQHKHFVSAKCDTRLFTFSSRNHFQGVAICWGSNSKTIGSVDNIQFLSNIDNDDGSCLIRLLSYTIYYLHEPDNQVVKLLVVLVDIMSLFTWFSESYARYWESW